MIAYEELCAALDQFNSESHAQSNSESHAQIDSEVHAEADGDVDVVDHRIADPLVGDAPDEFPPEAPAVAVDESFSVEATENLRRSDEPSSELDIGDVMSDDLV